MSWNVIATFVLDQVFGYQTANKIQQNLVVLASRRAGRYLGGSRTIPNDPVLNPFTGLWQSKSAGLGPTNVVDWMDIEIDGTNQAGITYQARVQCRTDRANVSITPRVYNVTDSTVAGTGSACAAASLDYSGTNQKQTIALTIASGVKTYRLQYSLNNVSGSTWMMGEVESFATA